MTELAYLPRLCVFCFRINHLLALRTTRSVWSPT
jgi:hypothetical protein